MSQFSSSSYGADAYDLNRPECPVGVLSKIERYCKIAATDDRRGSVLVDVGCGSGNSTRRLCDFLGGRSLIERFVGSDVSQTMVTFANSRRVVSDVRGPQISFVALDYSKLQEKFDRDSVDIITCMESVHWFTDINTFWRECHCILKPKRGVLAIWGYSDSVILEYPEFDDLLEELTYGDRKLGSYWTQPGRSIMRNYLRDIKFDEELFTDIEENIITVDDIRGNNVANPEYMMKKIMTIEDLKNYFKTFSSYHSWKAENRDAKVDIIDDAFASILEQAPALKIDSKVTVIWNSVYKLARKL